MPIGYFDDVDPAENFERQKRFTPYTSIYNVTGQPAVSVPLHWTEDGLPIGVMFVGRMGEREHPHLPVGSARGRPAVGGPAPADLGLMSRASLTP